MQRGSDAACGGATACERADALLRVPVCTARRSDARPRARMPPHHARHRALRHRCLSLWISCLHRRCSHGNRPNVAGGAAAPGGGHRRAHAVRFRQRQFEAVDFEGFRRRRGAKSAEPASLLYRDVEGERGLFERLAAARASSSRELILLTSDRKQLDLALNLIENLRELGLRHYPLLAQDATVCEALATRRVIACAWSSHLASAENISALRAAGTRDSMSRLWLQRQHYVGRLVGAAINTLLLDSDVVLSRDPYPYLKAPPFSRFHAIVLGDSTGAATRSTSTAASGTCRTRRRPTLARLLCRRRRGGRVADAPAPRVGGRPL